MYIQSDPHAHRGEHEGLIVYYAVTASSTDTGSSVST